MPKAVADDLIKRSGGSVPKLEKILGLNSGDLGDSPLRVDINNPTGLRMPAGNGKEANEFWLPGDIHQAIYQKPQLNLHH